MTDDDIISGVRALMEHQANLNGIMTNKYFSSRNIAIVAKFIIRSTI